MWLSKFVVFLILSSACTALTIYPYQKPIEESKDAFEAIRHALKKADIIDQVIDDFQPKCFVAPSYGKHKPVAFGNKLKQKKTKLKPSLNIYCPNVKSTPGLTIALTDPDAPSRDNPKWGEMCHWITLITAAAQTSTLQDLDLELELDPTCSADIVEYKPPGPPKKTGYHRYVFVLLEGDTTNITAPEDRQHWGTGKKGHGVRDWAEEEGLKVVGGNYFIEKH